MQGLSYVNSWYLLENYCFKMIDCFMCLNAHNICFDCWKKTHFILIFIKYRYSILIEWNHNEDSYILCLKYKINKWKHYKPILSHTHTIAHIVIFIGFLLYLGSYCRSIKTLWEILPHFVFKRNIHYIGCDRICNNGITKCKNAAKIEIKHKI